MPMTRERKERREKFKRKSVKQITFSRSSANLRGKKKSEESTQRISFPVPYLTPSREINLRFRNHSRNLRQSSASPSDIS